MTSPSGARTDRGFQDLTIVSFESRMAVEIARLIERYGGKPLVAPSLREVPLEDNSVVLEFGNRLLAGQIDVFIVLTGVGATALFELLKSRFLWASIMEALKQVSIVARGPKPAAALRALGLSPTVIVVEPNTTSDVVRALDAGVPVTGLRVAVQEYGAANVDLLEALQQREAKVFSVPIYRWALPDNLEPLREAIDKIIAGEVAVMLITNAAQVNHVMRVLEQDRKIEPFRSALKKLVVASIGPTTSERLRYYDWPVDLEPSHPKMGILVKEASEQGVAILDRKR